MQLHPRYFGRNLRDNLVSKLMKDVEGTCSFCHSSSSRHCHISSSTKGNNTLFPLLINLECCLKVSIPRKFQLGRKWQLGLAGVLHIIEALADNNSLKELNLADNSVPTELSSLQCDLPSKSCSHNQEDKLDTMKVDDNQEAFCSLNTLDEQLEVACYGHVISFEISISLVKFLI
ncbi:unnamed protein product [Trifolium pratense]|uniref:Uncharacterized protein n=1 Tax=Trifolium pratense TaxID=57577 RepID=A0ACB0J9V5_TRIPR|nr:unnamed protein product [Trifolium pratense]